MKRKQLKASVITLLLLAFYDCANATVFHIESGDVATLVAVINTANTSGEEDIIILESGHYSLNRVDNTGTDGPNGLPLIISSIRIKGAGAKDTIIERSSDAPPFRIFQVTSQGILTLEHVSVTGGQAGAPRPVGGAIFNEGELTLTNSIVRDNTAEAVGGIDNFGKLLVRESVISSNTATSGPVGGLRILGEAMLTSCTVNHNEARTSSSGGIEVTSGFINNIFVIGNAMLEKCNIYNNRADSDGGGILNGGALTLTKSIVRGNTARNGGGITNAFGLGGLIIDKSVIVYNEAREDGGGIFNIVNGIATVEDSIIAQNLAGKTGGGISNNSTMALKQSAIIRNKAGEQGGGISNSGILSLEQTVLKENEPDNCFPSSICP